jgi:hypothetical protein
VIATIGRILVAGVVLLSGACGDDDDGIASGELLALTYNVAGLPEGISGSNPAVNTPLISPLLNGYDLVLVQESWLTPDPNPLAPLRTYHEILAAQTNHPFVSEPLPAPINMNPERPSAIVSDGLNRFSDFPFGPVTRQRWFGCDDSSADCLSLKGFSVARTQLASGVCVDVYNLHGEAGNTENDRDLKEMNTRDLVDFMQSFSAGRAVILGGDFNMRLRRERDAANLNYLTSETGVIDACIDQGIIDDDAIDKFFYRSSDTVTLTPISCRFETDVFVGPDGEPLSDHDALAVGFVWSGSLQSAIDCL